MDRVAAVFGWITEHASVLATVVAAIATAFIAWFTIKLSGATTGQLNYLKKSSDLSSREFESTHRPRIVVQQVKHAKRGSFSESKPAYIEIVMANAGELPATIIDWSARLYFRRKEASLSPFLNEFKIDVTERDFVLESGDMKVVAAQHRELEDEYIEFIQEKAEMYVAGTVLYQGRDDFKRRTGFLRKWHVEDGTWRPVDHSEYEYAY